MKYLIIADWTKDFQPSRINYKSVEADAQALVDKLINDMPPGKEAPNAFYVPDPGVGVEFIVVDPVAKTVSVDTAKIAFAKWKALMLESDTLDMSREWEDHLEFDHGGVSQDKRPGGMRDRYDAKKIKRASKPNV